jgi:Tfp pilus tip-associated adhesin PilY1
MTNLQQTFATVFGTAFGSSSTTRTLAYDSSNTYQVTTAPNIDLYSVNYLNFVFGPKSNGNPIGRKTRLQIAKDALVSLVNVTANMNFGLMNYNLTQTAGSGDIDQGAHVAFTVQPIGTTTNTNATNWANRTKLVVAINSMVAGSRSPVTEALYEAYLYFSGSTPWGGLRNNAANIGGGLVENSGNDNYGQNSTGPVCTALAPCPTGAICNAATAALAAPHCTVGKYNSPMLNNPTQGNPASCQANFVIMVTEGQDESDGKANALIQALQFTVPGTMPAQIISPDLSVDSLQKTHNYTSRQFETSGQTALVVSGVTVCQGVANEPYCNGDQAGTAQDTATGSTNPNVPVPNNYVWLDELAWFMGQADNSPYNGAVDQIVGIQPVVTYTISFGGQTSAVISNAATVGGGQYYQASNAAALAAALQQALASLVAWRPSASAPSVPISSLNRTQSSTNAFLGFFGPTSTINWTGTVKNFALDTNAGDCANDVGATPAVCFVGQTSLPPLGAKNIVLSVNGVTVVNPLAVSFWTPPTGIIPAPIGGNYPLEDGGLPNSGGTGFQLVENGQPKLRNMYTYISALASTNDLTAGSNAMSNGAGNIITNAMVGAGTNAQRYQYVDWMRGGDIVNDTVTCGVTGNTCATWRAWAHSAVLHSVPKVVTYGVGQQTIFYVSTDGVLHAVDANTGKEQWSFMVEEALPQISTLLTNNFGAQFSVADGTPAIYTNINPATGILTSAYVYFGLRRGGQAYYALDVSTPATPKLLWKITPSQVCLGLTHSCAAAPAAYAEMGQTWSTPAVVSMASNPGNPSLVVGAGYDPLEDAYPYVGNGSGYDNMGRGLFIINGTNGQPLASFTHGTALADGSLMHYSVPSDPAALNMDSNAQGYVNRIYIGDTGANVFRFDYNAGTNTWAGRTFAQLADPSNPGYRKIFYPPVVVREGPQQAFGQRFDAVYTGTGDIEHPTIAYPRPALYSDMVFMIKDIYTGFVSAQPLPWLPAGQPNGSTTFPGGKFMNITGILTVGDAAFTAAGSNVTFMAAQGTYFQLSAGTGELVDGSPEVIGNILDFGTYSPSATANGSACLPVGSGQLYGIDAITGGPLNSVNGGLMTSATSKLYAGISGRGFVAPGGIIVIGGQVYRVTVVDGALNTIKAGSLLQSRNYWQKEPQF